MSSDPTPPPVPSAPAALSAYAPAQTASALTASTSPAVPARTTQATSPAPTAPQPPTHPVSSVPPAQPAQTAAPSTTTTVPHSPSTTTSHAPGSVAPPAIDEAIPTIIDSTVTREIERLWTEHVAAQASFEKNSKEHSKAEGSFRKSREELRDIRDRLSTLLHQVKPLISRPGCGGGWSSFLAERQISRSTADALVRSHAKTLATNAESNCSTRQIVDAPEIAIRHYLKRQWPRLSQLVKTPEDLEMFITALSETAEKSFDADGEAQGSTSNGAAQTG